MNEILTLLKPRLWTLTNRSLKKNARGGLLKLFLFGIIGLLFWIGIFAVSLRVLTYFRGIEEIGNILGYKLLSMILIVSFALLIFSSILTSLTKLYLSRDLQLVHAMPVASYKIFISRWIDSTVDSAWMVVIFTLPVFLAYGIVYQTDFYAAGFFSLRNCLSNRSILLCQHHLGTGRDGH